MLHCFIAYAILSHIIFPNAYAGILFFILGLVFGSFGNVLIYRLPKRKVITGRSKCTNCSKIILARDLVPVISFIFLLGKCRHCFKKISFIYPIIEIITGCIFLKAFLFSPSLLSAILLSLSLWLLLLITLIDFKTQGIPDALNIPFILISIAYGILLGHLSMLSFIIGVGFFAFQWIISRGRFIGSGDILLAIGLTALVGRWQAVLAMICTSYIIGGFVAAYLLLKRRKNSNEMLAFAPFLAAGTIIILFAGDWILNYLFLL